MKIIRNTWKISLENHMRSYSNENGVLTKFPEYLFYYTPKEWVDSIFDINEIIQTETFYAESFLLVAFIRLHFRKIKKEYEKKIIRLHRKQVCKVIAENPEIKIYEGQQLKEYQQWLKNAVYDTFEYQTRSISFRNVNIKGRCLNCSLLLSETNRNSYRYCSEDCKDSFYLEFDFNYSKDYVWQRDRGICQICKKSTRFIEEKIKKLWFMNDLTKQVECDIVMISIIEDERTIKYKRTKSNTGKIYYLPYQITIREYDSYEIDHIIEVSTGETKEEQVKLFIDYENMQTLCIPCHRKKTGDFLRNRFSKKVQAKIKAKVKIKKIKDFI